MTKKEKKKSSTWNDTLQIPHWQGAKCTSQLGEVTLPLALRPMAHQRHKTKAPRGYLLLWLRAKKSMLMTYICTVRFITHRGCSRAGCVQLCPSYSNS